MGGRFTGPANSVMQGSFGSREENFSRPLRFRRARFPSMRDGAHCLLGGFGRVCYVATHI